MIYPLLVAIYGAKKLYNLYGYYRERPRSSLEKPYDISNITIKEELTKLACLLTLVDLEKEFSQEEMQYIDSVLPKYLTETSKGILFCDNLIDKLKTYKKPLSFYLRIYRDKFKKTQSEMEDLIYILIDFSYKTEQNSLEKINKIEAAIIEFNLSPQLFSKAFQQWLKNQKSFFTRINYGSGFVISDVGLILTADHVVKNVKTIKVKAGNTLFTAQSISSDPALDLALLTINATLPALPFSGAPVKPGQGVIAFSFPKPEEYGYSLKVTNGAINALTGCQDHENYFQIDSIVDRGSSGGPLIDEKNGCIVGMLAQQHTKNTKCGYAIKYEILRTFLGSNFNISSLPKAPINSFLDRYAVIEKSSPSVVQIITFS